MSSSAVAPTPIRSIFSLPEGSHVVVRGWVYRKRVLKNKAFLVMRDSTGIIQSVFTDELAAEASKLNIESALYVSGVTKREERAPGGIELHVDKILWEFVGEQFPINEDAANADSELLLDLRHLWVRSRRMQAVLKIRSTVFAAVHDYFRSNGFYEVHAPTFISAAVEGGSTLFKVNYFNNDIVYLTQSAQFYLEALIYSLEKVYTIAPSFRAEQSRTRRHLTEFWHAEMEVAWAGLRDVMAVGEGVISHTINEVLQNNLEELSVIGRKTEYLERVKPPFPMVSYDEALELLKNKGINLKWGDDIGADEERALTLQFDKPIHLHHFPEVVKAFYHKNDPQRPETTLSVDILAPEGYGEVVGGGERIENYNELVEKIRRFGLDPSSYGWYLDLRRFGSVQHAGFGLGMDRLVMWICGLDHVRDALPFPRDMRRIRP
ncbi:MAG: asparagine--tRNA ligase [Thermocladium sp.]